MTDTRKRFDNEGLEAIANPESAALRSLEGENIEPVVFNMAAALAAGRAALGVPFCHQGRSVSGGFDCAGILFHMLHAGGWTARNPELTYALDYTREGSWRRIKASLEVETYEVPVEKPYDAVRPMDTLLMHWSRRKIPQHFAVVTAVTEFGIYAIQTHQELERVTESRFDDAVIQSVYGCYRWHGVIPSDPLLAALQACYKPDAEH